MGEIHEIGVSFGTKLEVQPPEISKQARDATREIVRPAAEALDLAFRCSGGGDREVAVDMLADAVLEITTT